MKKKTKDILICVGIGIAVWALGSIISFYFGFYKLELIIWAIFGFLTGKCLYSDDDTIKRQEQTIKSQKAYIEYLSKENNSLSQKNYELEEKIESLLDNEDSEDDQDLWDDDDLYNEELDD